MCTACALNVHCVHCTHTARKLDAHTAPHSLTCMQSAASFVLSLTAEQLSIEQADFQQLLAPRPRLHPSARPEPRLRLGWRRTRGQATATPIGQPRPQWRPGQSLAELPACGAPLALCLSPCASRPEPVTLCFPAPGQGARLRSRGEGSGRARGGGAAAGGGAAGGGGGGAAAGAPGGGGGGAGRRRSRARPRQRRRRLRRGGGRRAGGRAGTTGAAPGAAAPAGAQQTTRCAPAALCGGGGGAAAA